MEFTTDIFSQFDKKWALLTAGDKENFTDSYQITKMFIENKEQLLKRLLEE
nr:hypothetical protein [uncultured Butyrivibrio sp.]